MNWIAIFVLTIILIATSSLWYSEKLFGKCWMKLVKLKPSDIKKADMKIVFGGQILATLVMLFVLSMVIMYKGDSTFFEGFVTGILVWAGFVATKLAERSLWENASWDLFVINATISLINLVIAGGVLAVWQ